MPIRDRTYSLPTASLHVGLAAEDHHIKKIHLSGLDEEMTDYKLCAIGKKNVGKSALTQRYTTGKIKQDKNSPLLNNFHQGTVFKTSDDIDGIQSSLHILDTIGQDSNGKIPSEYLRRMDGFVVVYSVTDRLSFQMARQYVEQIVLRKKWWASRKKTKLQSLPLVIVANKTDLIDQRMVSRKEGEELAWEFGCSFYECAATLNTNSLRVKSIFHDVVNQIRCVISEKVQTTEISKVPRMIQRISSFKKRNQSTPCLEQSEKYQPRPRSHSTAYSV